MLISCMTGQLLMVDTAHVAITISQISHFNLGVFLIRLPSTRTRRSPCIVFLIADESNKCRVERAVSSSFEVDVIAVVRALGVGVGFPPRALLGARRRARSHG